MRFWNAVPRKQRSPFAIVISLWIFPVASGGALVWFSAVLR
jgi:hypothetical protein